MMGVMGQPHRRPPRTLRGVSARPLKGEKEPRVPTGDLEKGLQLCLRWGADRWQIPPFCPFTERGTQGWTYVLGPNWPYWGLGGSSMFSAKCSRLEGRL